MYNFNCIKWYRIEIEHYLEWHAFKFVRIIKIFKNKTIKYIDMFDFYFTFMSYFRIYFSKMQKYHHPTYVSFRS